MPRTAARTPPTALQQVYVKNRAAWRRWLSTHHLRSPGIWLVFDRKTSRPDRLAYADAVEEALCFGWIDSTTRPLDDARYQQLFTPRKPKSTWSRVNKDRVDRLVARGLMAEAGVAAIERAKANGSWSSLDAVEALVMPDDLLAALASAPGAAEHFAAFSPSARKGYLHWISQAVRTETRAHRVMQVARHAAANEKSRHFVPTPVPARKAAKKVAKKVAKKAAKKVAKKTTGRAAT
jgi:uncharacterized protein YdeI (YjbR/CyaY-like superfamily)